MKKFMTIKFLRIFLLVVEIFLSLGCSVFQKKVAIYERGNLANPNMALLPYPTEEIGKQHMFNAREGSVGGFGGAGGGCGCN